jgi:hypothetical protein
MVAISRRHFQYEYVDSRRYPSENASGGDPSGNTLLWSTAETEARRAQLAKRASELGEALYAQMQEPDFENVLRLAFDAPPAEIGSAAREAASKR